MASTYLRPDSQYVWIRFKDATGKWKNKNSGYRKDDGSEVRQAELLAREKSIVEARERPINPGKSAFNEWALQWVEQRWEAKSSLTLRKYRNCLRHWLEYLREQDQLNPATVRRETVMNYRTWRKEQGVGQNTIWQEVSWFGQLMDEAIERGFAVGNPTRKLGTGRGPVKHKEPWTDDELAAVGRALAESDSFGWMHVTFLMGFYQACRLNQCSVRLRLIDTRRQIINYADEGVKGGKGFSQPIDPDFLPVLRAMIEKRKDQGNTTLCDIPLMPSVEWRKFLDKLGFTHLCHHGLRATWITRAALSGVPENQAMRFANHAGTLIHRIYQRITATDLAPIFAVLNRPSFHEGKALALEATVCNVQE